MKALQMPVVLWVFILFIGTERLFAQNSITVYPPSSPGQAIIQEIVNTVSRDSIVTYVTALQSFGTRQEGTPQRDSAADYIVAKINSWGVQAESQPYTYSQVIFDDLEMINRDTICIVGSSKALLMTTNGGLTWEKRDVPGIPYGYYGVKFINSKVGWIAGSPASSVAYTTDGGSTWKSQTLGSTAFLYDIDFFGEQLGMVVGSPGAIIRTIDGGKNWGAVTTGLSGSLYKVKIVDANNAWVVGAGGAILHSTDAGATWSVQASGTVNALHSAHFYDSRLGWVVGDGNTVLRTTNGGNTWMKWAVPSAGTAAGDMLYDVYGSDSLHLWIGDVNAGLRTTTNGGQTWSRTNFPARIGRFNVHCIRQLGGKYFMACGSDGTIMRSTDGGTTWSNQMTNLPQSYLATSRNIVVTIPGQSTPENECVMVAHYDSGNCPGADDNASGTSAVMEAARILRNYKFESTVKLMAVSAEELWMIGSAEYVMQAKAQNRNIIGAVNGDMLGYPLTGDTTRLVIGSYLTRNRLVDLAILYNQRYGIGAKLDPFVDSTGASDYGPFAVAGYDALEVAEGTPTEIWGGLNPYYHKAGDTIDKLHPGLMRRATQLMVATIAELAKPFSGPAEPWVWKSPFPQWNDFRSVCSPGENTFVAVGDIGTIVKSVDGGRTWSEQTSNTRSNLNAASFANATTGVAVGDLGEIVRTVDGGASWKTQFTDSSITFLSVFLSDVNTGTAVGYPGAIYRTSDGGETWTSQPNGPASTLRSVYFLSADSGVVVGSAGSILRTTTGGKRWTRQSSGTTSDLYAVSFADSRIGVAVGMLGAMVRTTDGGASWNPVTNGVNQPLNAVTFVDAKNGLVIGEGGTMLRTSDEGASWSIVETESPDVFTGIAFAGPNSGSLVGTSGLIMRSTDGGTNWLVQSGALRVPLYGVRFTDAVAGTMVGYKGSVYVTDNGGTTWSKRPTGTINDLLSIDFPTAGTILTVGERGTILRSTDRGLSWLDETITPTESATVWFSGVAFSNTTTGVIVGRLDTLLGPRTSDSRSIVLRTIDAGVNWVRCSTSSRRGLLAVSFGDENTAFAVGEAGVIMRSTDNGVHWTELSQAGTSGRLNGVSFVDGVTGCIVGDGGIILRTTDGGSRWSRVTTGTAQNLRSVWFVNGSNGMAVGDNGTMLVTASGGKTWATVPPTSTKNLYAICFSDADRGTIVGDAGTVLRAAPTSGISDVRNDFGSMTPTEFALFQNYPNPFNPSTAISFRLSAASQVSLKVFDMLGREIASLIDGIRQQGVYTARWDASRQSSGVYFYRLIARSLDGQAKTSVATQRMVLIK